MATYYGFGIVGYLGGIDQSLIKFDTLPTSTIFG